MLGLRCSLLASFVATAVLPACDTGMCAAEVVIERETIEEADEPDPYEHARSASQRASFVIGEVDEAGAGGEVEVVLEPTQLGLLTRVENLACDGDTITSQIEGDAILHLATDDGSLALEYSGRIIIPQGGEPRLSLQSGVVADSDEQLAALTLPDAPEGMSTIAVTLEVQSDSNGSDLVIVRLELVEEDCSSCVITSQVLGSFTQPTATDLMGW